MYEALGKVNSITVDEAEPDQNEFGVAEIIELNQDDGEEDHSDDNDVEAGVHSIQVNKIPMGKTCSLYEVICVQTKMGYSL